MNSTRIRLKRSYGYHFAKKGAAFTRILVWKSVYSYAPDGKVKKYRFYFCDRAKACFKLSAAKVFKYNKDGQLIGIESRDAKDRRIQRTTYTYDTNSRRATQESRSFGFRGEVIGRLRISYTYDEWGNLAREDIKADRRAWERIEYTYDDYRRKVGEKVTSSKKCCESEARYTYRGSEVITEYAGGTRTVTSRNGGQIIRSYTPSGTLVSMHEKQFDEHGNEIYRKLTHFHCDCRGVRAEPVDMKRIAYVYY